jgi:uncharacterized protein YcaQ
VVRRLLAVQAQDGRAARLAIRARSVGLGAADVDRALSEERSLLITWLCRGTLHLVTSEDYPWLQALCAPGLLKGNARRLAQTGVEPSAAERGVRTIEQSLRASGPLTRSQLGEGLDAAGVATEGQALVHLLMLASLRGIVVRGPMVARQHAYALVSEWLGPQPTVDRKRALAELARRYLVGHGPASDRDLAKWAGLPLRDARGALECIGAELAVRGNGLVELRRARSMEAPVPRPRLLGAFDPVLHGWVSRARVTREHDSAIASGGLFRPFALIDGRAAATWRLTRSEVILEPLRELAAEETAALHRDGRDVLRYLSS